MQLLWVTWLLQDYLNIWTSVAPPVNCVLPERVPKDKRSIQSKRNVLRLKKPDIGLCLHFSRLAISGTLFWALTSLNFNCASRALTLPKWSLILIATAHFDITCGFVTCNSFSSLMQWELPGTLGRKGFPKGDWHAQQPEGCLYSKWPQGGNVTLFPYTTNTTRKEWLNLIAAEWLFICCFSSCLSSIPFLVSTLHPSCFLFLLISISLCLSNRT